MKRLSVLVFVLSSVLFQPFSSAFELGSLRIGDTSARKIAKSASLPGNRVQGQCLPYAIELNKRLRAAGIDSQVVGYHWRNEGQRGGHAVVAYNDKGRTYIMDNQSWRPHWVENAPVRAMVGQFEGMDLRIEKAWVVNTRIGSGRRIDEVSRRVLGANASSRKAPRLAGGA